MVKLMTIETVPGKNFEVLGLVQSNVVMTKHVGKDFLAAFRNLVGGEVSEYTELMYEARTIATKRLITEAETRGADAVIGLRYSTCSVMSGASEVMAYGTAVKFT